MQLLPKHCRKARDFAACQSFFWPKDRTIIPSSAIDTAFAVRTHVKRIVNVMLSTYLLFIIRYFLIKFLHIVILAFIGQV